MQKNKVSFYKIKRDRRAKRQYKIIRNDTGEIVGSSMFQTKAKRSIAYRDASLNLSKKK